MIVDHTHGVPNNRCDHPDCKAATARYFKQHRLDTARGIPRMVDAHDARMHVCSLLGKGWTRRTIAAAAGCSVHLVVEVATGRAEKIRRTSSTKLLSVNANQVPTRGIKSDDPFVVKTGSVRRIQALLAMGWPHRLQREHSGIATHLIISQRGWHVSRSTHDAIATMYRDLSKKAGPSDRSRLWATKLGYLGPTAWNDIDHDPEPEVEPTGRERRRGRPIDDVAIQRRTLGDRSVTLSPAEAEILVRRWAESGRPLAECERLTGLKPDRYARLRDLEEAS